MSTPQRYAVCCHAWGGQPSHTAVLRRPAFTEWGDMEDVDEAVAAAVQEGRRTGELRLSHMGLTSLPDALGSLTNLTRLDLSMNGLTVLPDFLGDLTNLTSLGLSGNELTDLPDSLGQLARLDLLALAGNPWVGLPPEVRTQGARAVTAYLRERAASGSERLWRSKLLIVGEATVGKTSLFKRLTDGEYDRAEPQTHGVHVEDVELEHPDRPGVVMRLSAWDFGGQLEYRATQRFYLTERSLFVLVWNARARWRDGKLLAWLDSITARAPHAPVLVVATHADDASAATLPEDLRTTYPGVVGIHEVDSRTGRGIDALREAIRTHAAALPLMGAEWPRAWARSADAVRALPGVRVGIGEANEVLAAAGVTRPDAQETVMRALHDLGDVVHFRDDRELASTVVLKPTWLDGRITAVLDSEPVARGRGLLGRDEAKRLWGEREPDLIDLLPRMMERFDLAYRVGDPDSSGDVALIVERLADARPDDVEKEWARAGEPPESVEVGYAFRLRSRQAGIPSWFIARMHRYTTGLHWSRGVLLHDRDPEHPAWALVEDDDSDRPTVSIRVRGRFPVSFLSVLADGFKQIVQQRYAGLVTATLVSCTCRGRGEPCGHHFSFDELMYEAHDRAPDATHQVRCQVSRQKLDARGLLAGLPDNGMTRSLRRVEEAVAEGRADTLRVLDTVRLLTNSRTQAGVHCPSLFDVEAVRRSWYGGRRVRVRLWCEWPYSGDSDLGLPGGPHRLPDGEGVYTFSQLPHGVRDFLPYLKFLIAGLGILAPVVTPGLFGATKEVTEQVLRGLETGDKLLDTLPDRWPGPDGRPGDAEPLSRRAILPAHFRELRKALEELDPATHWGGLNEAIRPEDQSIVYLCPAHYEALRYPYRPHAAPDPAPYRPHAAPDPAPYRPHAAP
ncbi:COR domain-containing protein [Streptantibioticus silvisoli]|uniref:non-specific serine/threonine protein kinase n=1 Tax=Streptantibioticus silvisoli TaxID=2705255 RepID=A0ABT6W7V8_9ACTN|nr:COR domain-containing protein [Streptantibioticus silvisoli]MDI5966837.1 COR domain-containing protein [Streptantibioticus silvisoli]